MLWFIGIVLVFVGGVIALGAWVIIQPPWFCALNQIPFLGWLFAAGDFFQCNLNFFLGLFVAIFGFIFFLGGSLNLFSKQKN